MKQFIVFFFHFFSSFSDYIIFFKNFDYSIITYQIIYRG